MGKGGKCSGDCNASWLRGKRGGAASIGKNKWPNWATTELTDTSAELYQSKYAL